MSITAPRAQTVSRLRAAPSEAASIAAYESLAQEYDLPTHETTRRLERASLEALERAKPMESLLAQNPWVVEIGAGTGALTLGLLTTQRVHRLLVTDPAARMLGRALAKVESLDPSTQVEGLHASATEVLSGLPHSPDLIVAGLADPYFSPEFLWQVRRVSGPHTYVFVTLPGSDWAAAERGARLQLPLDQTRFRMANGICLRSRSTTMHELELAGMFEACDFHAVRHGTVRLPATKRKPAPEVVWLLGHPQ